MQESICVLASCFKLGGIAWPMQSVENSALSILMAEQKQPAQQTKHVNPPCNSRGRERDRERERETRETERERERERESEIARDLEHAKRTMQALSIASFIDMYFRVEPYVLSGADTFDQTGCILALAPLEYMMSRFLFVWYFLFLRACCSLKGGQRHSQAQSTRAPRLGQCVLQEVRNRIWPSAGRSFAAGRRDMSRNMFVRT